MTSISLPDIELRLTLVVILCGAIGLERESRDRPAATSSTSSPSTARWSGASTASPKAT